MKPVLALHGKMYSNSKPTNFGSGGRENKGHQGKMSLSEEGFLCVFFFFYFSEQENPPNLHYLSVLSCNPNFQHWVLLFFLPSFPFPPLSLSQLATRAAKSK